MSVFLSVPRERWVAQNALAFALRDLHPVTEGHTLVIPKRLVVDFFETTDE
ncbi:MAG: HIT domain-containing protein, partial [Myxococcales bacterium]|nr:HIT domain-containing protein [Myxococcales bacterium]